MMAQVTGARRNSVAGVIGARAFWGAVDQGIFSLTSFGLAIAVARHATPAEFGAFGIAYVLYVLLLGTVEAFTAEVLVVRGAHLPPERQRHMLVAASGTAVACGGCLALIGALVALIGGAVLTFLAPMFLLAPLLFAQDVWRFGFFVMGRPRAAAANDALWAVLFIGVYAATTAAGTVSADHLVWAWSACGAVCGVVGAIQSRSRPAPRALRSWVREHGKTGGRFAGEYLSLFGAAQAVLIWVGVWTGLTQSAAFRGGQLLFGPIQLMLNSLRLAMSPLAVQAYRSHDLDTVRRFGIGISAAAVVLAALWGIVLIALPTALGREILGSSWSPARGALIPFWCLTIALAVGFGALVMLRAMAAVRTSFRIRLTSAVATFFLGGAAARGGAVAAASAVATVVAFTSLAMWTRAWQLSGEAKRRAPKAGSSPEFRTTRAAEPALQGDARRRGSN